MNEPKLKAFVDRFSQLTGNEPFPWQMALYVRFTSDRPDNIPASCNLPTGLGKTSVIAVWLIALATKANVPRRLVYVVNRRTVVDQTTEEVENYRRSRVDPIPNFEISTLRGQFADNGKWSEDPSMPAVICGTVDMIGSRLLFSGYGIGRGKRPLHAGFLGQDALLVHDEAHLEPAFQELITAIEKEQRRCGEFCPFRVMELTATSRGDGEVFGLTDEDMANSVVQQRVNAKKAIQLHLLRDKNKVAEQVTQQALNFKDSGRAILVFVHTVEDVLKVRDKLPEKSVETLTGTMRGLERDALVKNKTFARFLPRPPADATPGTVYLVCTSAGEVGVNISADHLVCDLSTFESMAQRLGRVNRFGMFDACEVHIVYPNEFKKDYEYDARRAKTLELFRRLNGNGSPTALSNLPPTDRQAAFAPTPTILPTTDILFDAWSLTTIPGKLPGRPKIEPYLHGLPTEWQPPETHVAWREEVSEITGDLLRQYDPTELLNDFPLKPHELLKEPSYRAFKHLETMAKRLGDRQIPVWLLDDDGNVDVLTVAELADKSDKERINRMTVILPPSAGGLSNGLLDGDSPDANDVADEWFIKGSEGQLVRQRKRLWNADAEDDPDVADMHLIRTIAFPGAEEDADEETWEWLALANEGDKSAKKPVLWEVHVDDVVARATAIVANLPLNGALKRAIVVAAKLHDQGKLRTLFQRVLGNSDPNLWLAKSGKRGGKVAETYRHEFGSLFDTRAAHEFTEIEDEDLRELVLHLIAAHHGRARPHFPLEEVFDPERSPSEAEAIASEVPRRFARLQRRYGRWGLAYLESLLRAADWAASAKPSQTLEDQR